MTITDWMVLGKVYGPHASDRFAFWSRDLGFTGTFFCGQNTISGSKSAFMVDGVAAFPGDGFGWNVLSSVIFCLRRVSHNRVVTFLFFLIGLGNMFYRVFTVGVKYFDKKIDIFYRKQNFKILRTFLI